MADVAATDSALDVSDFVIIVLYFSLILFIGLWSSRQNRGSVGGYFLAGRNMHWLPLGASLFASNVGSLHFVGLAGSGVETGISSATYELNAMFVLILLGWYFLPVYITSGVFTMPEYVQKRYGGQRIRVYLAVLSLLMYIFTKISADLYAGAIFIEQALQWNMYVAVCLLLAIAAIFTITGGLTAVIWTDFIQTIIMMIGATALCILCFIEVGGFEGMVHSYAQAIPTSALGRNDSCGRPRDDYMNLIRDPVTADIPWPGLIGLTINSIWYWCADQVIVQRALAGKTFSHAKAGTMFCSYLKILPMFLLIFPGMIARILYTDDVACIDPDECWEICKSRAGCSNIAYPRLVLDLMPAGARGMMLAVMLSALMSSLTSIFNSSSTVFTMDIWRRIRQQASDVELMVVGRVCVLVLVAVSVAWIPIIQASASTQLFIYINTVSSFLQPPICAVYILGISWGRITEKAAFWSLMVGLLTGGLRFVLEFAVYPSPACGEPDTRPSFIKDFHYLYFSIFLFSLTVLLCVVISLLTKPIPEQHLYRLTFWTRHSKKPRVDLDEDEKVENTANGGQDADNTLGKSSVDDEEDVPCWKRSMQWICGIEKQVDTSGLTAEERAEQERLKAEQHMSIAEPKRVKSFLDVNAILLCSIALFIWGFFH